MRTVHLIGAPLDLGGARRGTDMGPSAFRIAGLADQLVTLGVTVVDKGDIATPIPEAKGAGDPRKRYVKEIAKICQKLYQTALASLDDGALPIVLGGDHSLAAGTVAASAAHVVRQDKPLGLIWVDAHGDMNNPATSGSGNVHGMPLAALLGSDPIELAHFHGEGPAILPKHTVLVGIRNLDTIEKEIVKASRVHVFTMKDVDRLGITEVMERALVIAGRGTGGIHVSFDLDVCDPGIAPGVGTPVKGGLDYREAHVVMEMAADSGKLVALDLVEVNPALDLRNTTAELGVELALSALGKQIL
jgi:arginase